MRNWLCFPVVLGLVLTAPAADFGEKVTFTKGKTLTFPDCELVYLGERTVSSLVFKPGFTFYDFKATSGGETKIVSWTSGTGDLGPTLFEIQGRKFLLELRASDAFKGWLKNDELVLWRDKIARRK